jgi:hypothetical protein
MDIFEIMISMIKHILYVIIIMLIYGIKIIRKMPIFLTELSTHQMKITCTSCHIHSLPVTLLYLLSVSSTISQQEPD